VHLRGTKTAGAERTVTVAPFARELLAFALAHGEGKDGLVVRPWGNARRGLARACERIGAPRVTWNDLRRTISTWLVEGGVSDTVIAKLLGHADTTMLHRVYGKPRDEAMGALLLRQSAALPRVRVVYVSPSESNRTGPNASEATIGKHSKQGGPTGTRTRDLRIKSLGAECAGGLEKQENGDAAAGDVHVVYASQRVTADTCQTMAPEPDVADASEISCSIEIAAPASDRGTTCTELLRAVKQGQEAETRALAVRLAHEVLSSRAILLAHEVLAGGPHATAKALELAESLLEGNAGPVAFLPAIGGER
jgi:integrase-like protein